MTAGIAGDVASWHPSSGLTLLVALHHHQPIVVPPSLSVTQWRHQPWGWSNKVTVTLELGLLQPHLPQWVLGPRFQYRDSKQIFEQ